ncbi:SpoIIE family protein phosphatase [Streptomyces sp. NPDC002738]
MTASSDRAFSFDDIAIALIDSEGIVLRWSLAAADMLDLTAAEVCGRPVWQLLAEAPDRDQAEIPCEAGIPAAGRAALRHGSGRTIEVTFQALQLESSPERLILAAPTQSVATWGDSVAFMRALLAQDRVGVGIHDTELNVMQTNITNDTFGGLTLPVGSRLGEAMATEDAMEAEAVLRQVLDTGVPVIDREQHVRSPNAPGRQWTVSLSAFRLEDSKGRPTGVAAVLTDASKHYQVRRCLDLSEAASVQIGASLDVTCTAQDLVDALVPALGDLAWVDLAEAVLEGDEPPKTLVGDSKWHMRRAAAATVTRCWPAGIHPAGTQLPPLRPAPLLRGLQRGETFFLPDRASILDAAAETPEVIPQVVPGDGHSVVMAPLSARGLLLGTVVVWRIEQPEAFGQEDADLLEAIASRAALSVDNARRYTREHRAAVALQQRLLPRATTDIPAAETAGLYRPAGGGTDISGDWFDVIPLSSLRVSFVVGDVIGHGLHATATMGRLRTAVQTLADLDLDPDELLTHLDDLVQQLADEVPPGHQDTVGATCLYAVYDPVTCRCTLASAGHLPPVIVRPDGTVQAMEISPGPPLGVGGLPFEVTETVLPPGSTLALYTNGLIERDDDDIDAAIQRLADNIAVLCRSDRALDDIGRALLTGTDSAPPRDDIALLLARTCAVPPHNIASWEFPADLAVVADARKVTTQQLAEWGLGELAFTTELVVSELVTNAIRYAGGPIGLRLIRERGLVCEVSDPSNTQPRLRRARATDEGGRGLFLVAQLTARWGSRYGRSGKTIWTEQPLQQGPL